LTDKLSVKFSPDQVAELKGLGLIDEQVAELEARLPTIAGWLRPVAAASEVRAQLKALEAGLLKIQSARLRPRPKTPPWLCISQRLAMKPEHGLS